MRKVSYKSGKMWKSRRVERTAGCTSKGEGVCESRRECVKDMLCRVNEIHVGGAKVHNTVKQWKSSENGSRQNYGRRSRTVAEERVSKYVNRRAKMQENRQSARG